VTARSTGQALLRLRWQMTAWYVGTFALILLVLGTALLGVITHQFKADLDTSLQAATGAVEQAAEVREVEAVSGEAAVDGDAVSELKIPGRSLYLFDSAGALLTPDSAEMQVRETAKLAASSGEADRGFERFPHTIQKRDLQVHAERFTVRTGRRYVAAAVADRIEVEERYASLIGMVVAAASAALVLVAVGGWFLAGKATEPVERTMAHMRRFMADAAHELRTPVAVLRSRAEVALQQPREPAAYVAALSAVGAESERVGGIVDNLLTLARADAGEWPVVRDRVYLDDLAIDAVDSVRVLAERRGVELSVTEFEEAAVEGDPVLLRQLIVILLDNAVKFTASGGGVSLRVGVDGGRATLLVEDTGVGIPEEELPRIFDRFYRGGGARSQASGAGLGLSIARWIADMHEGTIVVESTVGKGTRTTIRFPSA
jgi:signal transduction histidine kinase